VRVFLACLVWLITTALLAPVIFFAVIFLAGPHSSVLPSALQPVVVIAALIVLLGAPIWLARRMLRKRSPSPS
jgi:hypothetical protein